MLEGEERGLQGVDRGCVAGIEEVAGDCKMNGFGGKYGVGQTPLEGGVGGDGEIID